VQAAPEPVTAVSAAGTARLPTAWGEFAATAYVDADDVEHLVLVLGDAADDAAVEAPLVRVHSECLTGDLLGSKRCDCGDQLERSLELISNEGRGVLVYMRGHEGRGVGLAHKIRAYGLQDEGLDTVDANLAQGLPADGRRYHAAGFMLLDLGVTQARLLTNNPAKVADITEAGVEIVERVPVAVEPNEMNARYLSAKRERLGHLLEIPTIDP